MCRIPTPGWSTILALVLVACGGSTGGPIADDDVTGDAAVDAPVDAAGDVTPDAGVDAPDAPPPPCEVSAVVGDVTTLTGCGAAGAVDGPTGTAHFANPVNVLVVGAEVLVADFDNDRVRAVSAAGMTRTLVAQPGFQRPFGLALIDDTLYVSTDDDDTGQHSTTTGTVWRVDRATGVATVVARHLGRPRGLLGLPDGRLAMSDYLHHTVSLLDPATGQVTLLAGGLDQAGYADGRGAAARFANAYGLAWLPDGRIAVADFGNHRLRTVTLDGVVATLAGSGELGRVDGAAATARFGYPQALASDAAGRLYVSDTDSFTVRRLADGVVTTIAGSGIGGWRDGARLDAQFFGLEGVALGPDGTTLWVADGSRGEDLPYHRVRRLTLP